MVLREGQALPMSKRGFTLLEVLIAGSILFVVSAAVIGLNNSLIQGTSKVADRTQMNRWAVEGLDLFEKVRNDRDGSSVWLEQAEKVDKYGFYYWNSFGVLQGGGNNEIALIDINTNSAEELRSGVFSAFRMICVEAVGANKQSDDLNIYCNRTGGGGVNDGDRGVPNDCSDGDAYCNFTQVSLNKDRLNSNKILIPGGNAVKVRSIVVWQDRGETQLTEATTLMTNWRPLLNN